MGLYLTAIGQRRVVDEEHPDGIWVTLDIPIQGTRHDNGPYYYQNSYGVTEPRQHKRGRMGRWAFDFLRYKEIGPSNCRGLPDDLVVPAPVPGKHGYCLDEDNNENSWLLLSEILDYDFDRVYRDCKEQITIRDYVGNPFIEYMQELKDQGVERIVFGF
jgi:hypothetical protein